jgi:hypothetical protein
LSATRVRYGKPDVRGHLLVQKFGSEAPEVAPKYLVGRGDDWFDFRSKVDTGWRIAERVEKYFPDDEEKRNRYGSCSQTFF